MCRIEAPMCPTMVQISGTTRFGSMDLSREEMGGRKTVNRRNLECSLPRSPETPLREAGLTYARAMAKMNSGRSAGV